MAQSADLIVIGAGIVGAAVAHRASASGLKVAVLERGLPAEQGSGTTAGNVHIQTIHTRRPGQRVPVDVRRLLPLQLAARVRWETWEDEIGSVGFRRTGGFMVAETAEQVGELHRKAEWEQEIGIPSEVVDGRTARERLSLFGSTVAAATWCPWDGFADPALVTAALLRAAAERGAVLHIKTPVRSIAQRPTGWLVSAAADSWTAPAVVNAAGPWIGEVSRLAGAQVMMTPTAIQMHTLTPGDLRLPFVIAHVGEGLSVKQTDDGQIMVGGGWPAAPFSSTRPADVEPASIEGNLAQVRRILPKVGARPLDRVWTGPLASSPDEMPVIGAMAGLPGMFVVGGTYSFTLAPLWGDLTVALINGAPPVVDIDDLAPDRLLGRGLEFAERDTT